MTKDREPTIFLYLSARKDTVIPPSQKSSYLPCNGLEGGKKFQETGKTCNRLGKGRKRTI